MSFSTIIDKYRNQSFSTADQGTRFENLSKAFLQTSSMFSGQGIKDIWLWNQFPSKKDFGSGHDVGIDLVVRTESNEYWAIQCKCYGEKTQIDKAAVDTFISSSGRMFHDVDDLNKTVNFSRRLWLDTSGKGFTQNAEDSLKGQNPPVSRLSYRDLENSDVDWDKLDEGLYGKTAQKVKYEPRHHQQEAIDKAFEYYKNHERGKLIMACGTGKTFTSLKIAETETQGSNGTILFLAPSIALVGQTLKEWCEQSLNPIHGVCVCSDPKITKKISDDDEQSASVIDLAFPASTSVSDIMSQLDNARKLQAEDNGLVVIFSTYQSISVVHSVQEQMGDNLVFDVCVCDEAHRTTGVTLKDKEDSEFVKVHDPIFINAKRRLYMTATPRLYNDSAKQKAQESDAILCSMDDESIYGEEIYRIGFGEAVKLGLLSDYKVMILTLNEDDMSDALQAAIRTEDSEIPTDDSVKLIGCINALSKITKDEELLQQVDPGLMHNAIAFCQNIKTSKKMVSYLESCRDAYYDTLTEEERAGIVSVNAQHIDGSMGAVERAEKLNWLKKVDRNGSQCNVLMNVKCLSEGVDVPSLDAVLFLSARNSQVDVVQSVGRVMRKAPGKKYGYIIIPVVIPSNVKPEDALDDNKRFAVVWTVLQALRAHDDRFNATINKIELNKKKKPDNILIGGKVDPSNDGDSDNTGSDAVENEVGKQLTFSFDEYQGAIFAKMVEKCGDRRYWEQWAVDIAKIAERHIDQINKMISVDGSSAQKAYNRYLKGLRKNINPSVSDEDAVEMLAQHFITQPVFEALFENYSFVNSNPISKAMAGMVKILHEQTPKEDNEKLERFYESVRERCKGLDNGSAKQKVIVELYDKFFKTAFPKTVEKLGIVYTPVEVVDFIINSVEDILKKEFGRSMTDENVHILDPFTGTGTFIVRLLQSGIIKPEDLGRKYKNELHACEIVLLAYYIASINVENAYHDLLEESHDIAFPNSLEAKYDMIASDLEPGCVVKQEYESFDGIVLTDTFQMTEDNSALFDDMFSQNSARANKLKKTPLTVIIGNPPYSVGQKSANDNAQNQAYENLDSSIASSYVSLSDSSNSKAVYDSYVKAFRWASDRLIDKDGVIGFVTNAGWLDGNAMDGMRKCFEKEFASIYIFNLRGNCRTSGELRRKEGDNVFGLGSRTPIAITILVKKSKHTGKAKIYYNSVGDYLKRDDKLNLCVNYHSVLDKSFKKVVLTPNEHGDWLSKRNDHFMEFIPIIKDKATNDKNSFWDVSCYGLTTSRDTYVTNYNSEKLKSNILKQIDFFNSEIDRLKENKDSELNVDKCFSWSRGAKNLVRKGIKISDDSDNYRLEMYRPFIKENVYFSRDLNEYIYKLDSFYPKPNVDNLSIAISGRGSTKNFSCFMTNIIPDIQLLMNGQCYPLYWYKEKSLEQMDLFYDGSVSYKRYDGITDFILNRAKEKYGPKVTKEDIFYYVYGILNEKNYAVKFEADLKKMLPRLPLVSEPKMFWAFSKAGRELAELHLNYEAVPAYENAVVEGDRGNYDVVKMRYPKKGQIDTIIYNNDIVIKNIPERAYEYVINGKSAIDWIMERYQVTVDKKSGIKNDPNDWGKEHNNPRYILDLLLSIINVSIKTMDIIDNLPVVDWDNE